MDWKTLSVIFAGLILVGILVFFAIRSRKRIPPLSPEDRLGKLDAERQAEEKRIREDIKKETDQQLAEHFRRLVDSPKSKEDEK